MKTYKHVGKLKNTGAKVVVAFRTLPGESDKALVLPTATLADQYHDALMQLVESDQGQEAFEFGEVMFIRHFPDGRPMLRAMQADGRLQKYPTDQIIMTPNVNSEIPLDQLNVFIAEQKNCAVDELCNFVSGAPGAQRDKKVVEEPVTRQPVTELVEDAVKTEDQPLSDKDLAKSYRSQADALYKEAARLRREAEALDPTAKKTANTVES